MKLHFSDAEGRVLHGLLEDTSGDIVLRLDSAGFVMHASENAADLGMDLSSLLLMPHIADFADRDYGVEVARYVAAILGQHDTGEDAAPAWIEFPVRSCTINDDCSHKDCRHWYALSLRVIEPDDGAPQGALGLMRSVQHKYSLEGELNARALTDPLTGLANRHALCAAMRRTIASGEQACLAVFAIDRMRAIFMQYGQRTADEIQWGFAKFLDTMTIPGQELAQLDDERFGVLLPGMTTKQSREWASDVLSTFAGLAVTPTSRAPDLTASAGLTVVEMTVDWTLRQAELGLVLARAGGGMQIGFGGRPRSPAPIACGAPVQRAMEEAVQRGEDRQRSAGSL